MSTVPPHHSPEDAATRIVEAILYLITVLLVWAVFIGRFIFAILLILGRRVYLLTSDPVFHQVMYQLGRRVFESATSVFDAIRNYSVAQTPPYVGMHSSLLPCIVYQTVTTETYSSPSQPHQPATIPPSPPVFLFSPSRPPDPAPPSVMDCSPEIREEPVRPPSPVPVASTSAAPLPTPVAPPRDSVDPESSLSPIDLLVPLGVSKTQLIGETCATLQPETGIPGRWYSVVVGYRVGVFQSWSTHVHDMIDRVPGNRCQAFNSRAEAVADFVAALRAGAVRVYPTLVQLAEMQTLAADLTSKKPDNDDAK